MYSHFWMAKGTFQHFAAKGGNDLSYTRGSNLSNDFLHWHVIHNFIMWSFYLISFSYYLLCHPCGVLIVFLLCKGHNKIKLDSLLLS